MGAARSSRQEWFEGPDRESGFSHPFGGCRFRTTRRIVQKNSAHPRNKTAFDVGGLCRRRCNARTDRKVSRGHASGLLLIQEASSRGLCGGGLWGEWRRLGCIIEPSSLLRACERRTGQPAGEWPSMRGFAPSWTRCIFMSSRERAIFSPKYPADLSDNNMNGHLG